VGEFAPSSAAGAQFSAEAIRRASGTLEVPVLEPPKHGNSIMTTRTLRNPKVATALLLVTIWVMSIFPRFVARNFWTIVLAGVLICFSLVWLLASAVRRPRLDSGR